MPKCDKCTDLLPPNFCTPTGIEDDFLCVFCRNEITEITTNQKDGSTQKYTKKQCVKDYQKLLNYMKEKTENMADIKDQAKGISDAGLILPGTEEFNKVLKGT
jgi:hypothetical protein